MSIASRDTHFLIFEGTAYKNLDEFGAQLFSVINFDILSEDFPIRSIGGDRFIVGFIKNPPLEQLIRKMSEYKIKNTSFDIIKEMLDISKEKISGIIFFLNNKIVNYNEIQIAISKLKLEIKKEIKRVLVRKDMFIIFVQIEKTSSMMDNLKYLIVNNQIFKSTCNLSPEFHNNIGKLILENCPLTSPIIFRKFLTKVMKLDKQYIERIYQFRRPNNNKKGKNMAAYIIWIRNPKNIRKTLLSVIDYSTDKNKVGFFKWPNSKANLHTPLTNDLM